MNSKVLIVEDDQAMAVALRDGFEYEGYAVQVARDGAAGLKLATEKELDLIILDVMLPKMSGFDVCKQLRSSGNSTPIIMLTARGQEIDKVVGLKIGADDYVTKPFSFMELMARVEALLRRSHRRAEVADEFHFGDIAVNQKV
ncbi:MAG: response regulator transcription factor [Acidobacteriota bacterium]